MVNDFLGIPFPIVGLICLVIAVFYYFIWPKPRGSAPRPPWAQIVLRYAHSLVWVLLACACFLWAGNRQSGVASVLGFLALVMYVVFLVTFFRYRRA